MFVIFFYFCIVQALPINNTDVEKNFELDDSRMNLTEALQKINSLRHGKSRTWDTLASFTVGGLLAALDFVGEIMDENGGTYNRSNNLRVPRQEITSFATTTITAPITETTVVVPTTEFEFPIFNDSLNEIDSDRIRSAREGENAMKKNESKAREEEDDDEGGGGGLLGAIISGFLGSLSKPDGGVDIDAVVSVIGSLSAMKEDGSYDFSGLTDTLDAFFGGGDDGGGSDVGSFVGGLAAASIAGIASPPGAKGAGSFVGNLLKQVLPALSAPDPSEATDGKPQEGDAGGFLFSLLNSLFGAPATPSNPTPSFSFITIKMNLIKFLFSTISSILSSSSKSS
ncbi:hypothetical protein FQR65_LT02872 [Abscondita terminalis]|nr:hypothetical protein FQR65_LT02872 [Abscondita terminalis]